MFNCSKRELREIETYSSVDVTEITVEWQIQEKLSYKEMIEDIDRPGNDGSEEAVSASLNEAHKGVPRNQDNQILMNKR